MWSLETLAGYYTGIEEEMIDHPLKRYCSNNEEDTDK